MMQASMILGEDRMKLEGRHLQKCNLPHLFEAALVGVEENLSRH